MKTLYGGRDYTFGQLMLTLRNKIGLTQEQLGECVGVSWRSVSDWETGTSYPKAERLKAFIVLAVKTRAFVEGSEVEAIRALWKAARQKALLDEHWLSLLLSEPASQEALQVAPPQRAENETDALLHDEDQRAPKIQNLPFPPNPFFTGRESELLMMAHLFEQNERIALTQPISISGLGGIGKTQLALEYAHRSYPGVYRSVFFVNAADKATLEVSYLSLAHLLKLPERNEREIDRIVQAIKIWLEEHTYWLLILDNADDLELACSYLPTRPCGHILLTTRTQIVGDLAALIQVPAMLPAEGLVFLLRRSGLLKSGTPLESIASDIRREAEVLVEMLAGHPLALDQAGAYIEEISDPSIEATCVSFAEYRQLYQERQRVFLKRRGSPGGRHPQSVALTFEISLKKACELHPSCADVLSFCSLLHPDAIPEEMLCQQTALDLDPLLFNEAIVALRRYSLVKRDREKRVLSVHRLVQAVIKDRMDTQELGLWIERVVRAVNRAFPEVTFEEWPRCEQLLPHVQLCAIWIEREVVAPAEAAHLLRKAGKYLQERGLYTDAEPLTVQALSICEQYLGASHPDTATCLNNLAILYSQQGKYEQAEPLHKRALAIREQHLGASHPDTTTCLNNLAILYWRQGKYQQAEPLYQRALAIREQYLGASHPDTATCLNNLAILYSQQGKYEQAEPLHKRALAIREQHLGASHPNTATCLNNLALLYCDQGKYEQAEPLYLRALAIREQHLGAEHPETAASLESLALLYKQQGKYEQAEPLYLRALAIREQHLGAEHPETAGNLNNLAELYQQQGKYEQAEPLYLRALAIREQHLGAEHPDTAESLHGLADLYQQQGKYEQAEPLYLRALAIREQYLGVSHPATAESLYGLAQLCQHQGKHEQAEALYRRALHIREQRLGPAHPDTQEIQKAYAAFLRLVERDEKGTVLDVDHQPSTEEG